MRGRSKYRSVRTSCGKHEHASKKEAARCVVLQLMEKGREIRGLVSQPTFPLDVNGERIGKYIADFEYYTKMDDYVVEDCKGFKTPEYRLKKKLMKAIYGIEVRET